MELLLPTWCIVVDVYGWEHEGAIASCLQQHGLRILSAEQLHCNRTSARRLLQSMCFATPTAQEAPSNSLSKSGARGPKKPSGGKTASGPDLSLFALPRVRPGDVTCLTQGPCAALTITVVEHSEASGSGTASPKAKGGKGAHKPSVPPSWTAASLAAALPDIVGPLPAAGPSSSSSSPRSAKSSKSAAGAHADMRSVVSAQVRASHPPQDDDEGGAFRPASAASRTTGSISGAASQSFTASPGDAVSTDTPSTPSLPPPPRGAVHVYAPFTEEALARTQALVARLAQAAAAAAELAATKASRGKTAYIPEGPLFEFLFPAHVQHPKSAARLFAVGMFGPLDEDSGLLRGGVGGRRVLSDYELHALLDELAEEDALAVCVPREHARGLQPEQKAEALRSVRDIVPDLPRVSPSQVSALLAGVPRDDTGRLAFAALQAAIVKARAQRVQSLKKMYPALAAARGGGAALSAPPSKGGRGALAPRFTGQEVHTSLLRDTAAREGELGATGGPLALSVAMDGVLPRGVGPRDSGARRSQEGRQGPTGGRLAASMGSTLPGSTKGGRMKSQGSRTGKGRGGLLQKAGGYTLGGGGLRTGEETDASFLDVRLQRGENARRRKTEQLLQRNSHKVVALGSSNSAALAANAILLRAEPPPDMPSFNAMVALKGAGTGSYVHAPFSNTQAKKLVQR